MTESASALDLPILPPAPTPDAASDSSSLGSAPSIEETPREARVRRARETAKREYLRPQIDDPGWFQSDIIIELLQLGDRRQTHGLEEVSFWECLEKAVKAQLGGTHSRAAVELGFAITDLYARAEYAAVVDLVSSCIGVAARRAAGPQSDLVIDTSNFLHTTLSSLRSSHLSSRPTPSDSGLAGKKRHLEKKTALEPHVLETGLCALSHLLRASQPSSSQEKRLRASAILILGAAATICKDDTHDSRADALCDDDSPEWKRVHWTSTPGVALAAAEVCMQLGMHVAALEMLALFIGVTHISWTARLLVHRAALTYASALNTRVTPASVADPHPSAPPDLGSLRVSADDASKQVYYISLAIELRHLAQAHATHAYMLCPPERRAKLLDQLRAADPHHTESSLLAASSSECSPSTPPRTVTSPLLPPYAHIILHRCLSLRGTTALQLARSYGTLLATGTLPGDFVHSTREETDDMSGMRSVRSL